VGDLCKPHEQRDQRTVDENQKADLILASGCDLNSLSGEARHGYSPELEGVLLNLGLYSVNQIAGSG
jgi:hypothetical protein